MSAQDPRSEVDFGVWHDDRGSVRAVWQAHSGQLVAIALTGPHAGQSAVLGLLPPSGHPDPRRSALIAEAVMAGWAQHSGRPASRAWLQDRLDALAGVRLETIDWTVACPIPGCPRHAEAISPPQRRVGRDLRALPGRPPGRRPAGWRPRCAAASGNWPSKLSEIETRPSPTRSPAC